MSPHPLLKAERGRAFADAVIAIAMTLLILPLMDTVGEVARRGDGTLAWASDHSNQLVSFVLSFVLIALFWLGHYRLFEYVDQMDTALVWWTIGWLLCIVFLPVATSLVGQMASDDAATKVVYVGTMIAITLFLLAQQVYLIRHPQLHHAPPERLRVGVAAELATVVCFVLALAVMVAVPSWGYYPMFVMFLSGVIQRVVAHRMGVTES